MHFVGISELVMNSDDLAKHLADSYPKIKMSPGSSSATSNVADEASFYIYPDLINDEDGIEKKFITKKLN